MLLPLLLLVSPCSAPLYEKDFANFHLGFARQDRPIAERAAAPAAARKFLFRCEKNFVNFRSSVGPPGIASFAAVRYLRAARCGGYADPWRFQ